MSKESPNELKIINKNERLKYQKLLYEKEQQIDQLKQQLAEKDKEFTPKFEFRQKIYVVDNDYKGNYVIREKHYAGYFVNYYARYKYQIWCGEDNFYPVEYCFATREKAEEKIKELKGE